MLDATSQSLQYALDGLTMRQTVLADNIANQGTPGYQAKAVDFESAMSDALDGGHAPDVTPTVAGTGAASQPDGNNVDLGDSLVGMQATTMRYQTVSEALSSKFQLIKDSSAGNF
ncbi:flagellar basal body rod protein FlgB [Acidothermaceae bacterium B102]|nr:flagellar basal body rod protein FlgB [Acidothermaceae bacterium B102]